jgi:thiol-disulfide isomerase/thioredoxin
MRRLALWLLVPATVALAGDFDGRWDATIASGAAHIPFRMEVSESPARVCFFEDTQPACSTSAEIKDGTLTARWDYINTELQLRVKDGALTGSYASLRSQRSRPSAIEAKHYQPPPPPAQPPAKLDGEWEIHTKAPTAGNQLLLQQSGADLKGTILRVDGDEGTLVGRVDGNHFLISHFSGDRAVALEGTLLADGTIDLTQGNSKMTAYRPAAARAHNLLAPDDPSMFAKAKDPAAKFRFSFPDLNGKTVTEDNFAGKPYIVTITGSWCPNCRDEAPFLSELYKTYHSQGLDIVGFCFEYADDPAYKPLKAFIAKYGIAYPMLLAGPPPRNLGEVVPQVEHIGAYPTSIYIGKDGRIKAVHTGFPSVGSGEELTRVKKEVRKIVEGMLADQPEK